MDNLHMILLLVRLECYTLVCKIKDEKSKINTISAERRGERTERPIRRLLGSWKGRSDVAARNFPASFDFWDNFKLQEQLSRGSVVVVHEEPHLQMTGILSYRPEETGDRRRRKNR
ncbi:hypothetical protein TNCV_2708291 [Trichonephila clavipes]|nr:hypothetical protein TNCV_2708291 [Trichonephila clavipes]